MSNYFYPTRGASPVGGYDTVTNDDASAEMIAAATVAARNTRSTFRADGSENSYLHIDEINFSIYLAADGGGGLFRIQDTDGTEIFTIDADETKDIKLRHIHLPANVGFQVVVFNAAITNASVSIAWHGHISFDAIR